MAKGLTCRATTKEGYNVIVEISGDGQSGLFIAEILATEALREGATKMHAHKPPKRVDMKRITVKADDYGELLQKVKLAIGENFGGIRTFYEEYP